MFQAPYVGNKSNSSHVCETDFSNVCYNIRAIYDNNIIQHNPDFKKSAMTFISLSLSLVFIFIRGKNIFIMIIINVGKYLTKVYLRDFRNIGVITFIISFSLTRIYTKDDILDYCNERLLAYVMTRKWTHLIERVA